MIYIDNRNFPGGPWAYFLSDQNYLPINVIFYATLSVLTFLADLLVVSKTLSSLICYFPNYNISFGGVGLFGVARESC